MKYVRYWHFQRAWYAEVTNTPTPERVYWHNSGTLQDLWNEKYLVEDSAWLTHKEVKKKLKEMYPDHILVKDKPFHYGARWNGYKHGSRY